MRRAQLARAPIRVILPGILLGLCLLALASSASSGAPQSSPVPVVFDPEIQLGGQTPFARLTKETEPTIAVNPRDPNNLVAGYHDRISSPSQRTCGFSYTLDEGRTWKDGGSVPLHSRGKTKMEICSDPALTADAEGRFFYSYLEIQITNGGFDTIDEVRVARSSDGGQTFSSVSTAVPDVKTGFPDKPYIAADARPGSPFLGRLYLTYTDFDFEGLTVQETVRVVVSVDGGATWSLPLSLSRTAPYESNTSLGGSIPVVGPDGTVYVFFADYNRLAGPLSIMFTKSGDGGQTWSQPAPVASGLTSPGLFYLRNADPLFGQPGYGVVANSFPTAAVAPDGTLYVAWVDFSAGSCEYTGSSRPPCENADVRLSLSRDGGESWTDPVKVSDDATVTDQFFPWIAVHPDGLLSLAWADKRLDPQNVDYDIFYTNWRGDAFLPNVRVTSESSNPGEGFSFAGDYFNLAATADEVHPVWGDLRTENARIYTARGVLQR